MENQKTTEEKPFKALSRICLNNWHYIDKKVLSFRDGINFFTGHSGSGKSTVIDALQVVLYANTEMCIRDRYTNTYLIGMLGSYIGIYVWYFHREEKQMMLVPALALVATVLCMTNYGVNDVLIHPIEAAQTSQKLKDGYYGALRFQNKLDYTKDRVYVISQNSNGLDYWVLRNMFTPVQINANYTWSIGVKYGDGDVFTPYKNIYSWRCV